MRGFEWLLVLLLLTCRLAKVVGITCSTDGPRPLPSPVKSDRAPLANVACITRSTERPRNRVLVLFECMQLSTGTDEADASKRCTRDCIALPVVAFASSVSVINTRTAVCVTEEDDTCATGGGATGAGTTTAEGAELSLLTRFDTSAAAGGTGPTRLRSIMGGANCPRWSPVVDFSTSFFT